MTDLPTDSPNEQVSKPEAQTPSEAESAPTPESVGSPDQPGAATPSPEQHAAASSDASQGQSSQNPASPASSTPAAESGSQSQDKQSSAASAQSSAASAQSSGTDQPKQAPAHAPILQGQVLRVTANEVFIRLEDQREGSAPLEDYAGQPLPKEGDAVSVIVEGQVREGKPLQLSKRHADELTFWDTVQPGDVLEGVITGMNKGGLDLDIGGARAFLPSSQVANRRIKDISTLIGEHTKCVVTQVDRTTHDLIVSRKKQQERERKEQRAQALAAIQEGDTKTGTVTNITEYGAFVDIGGVDGLLHMTDMSWGHVTDPKTVLQKGQQVRVRVLKVNREKGKVSLGLKQLKPNPWEDIETRYPKGKRMKVKIARIANFGAFIELEEGVDALLPLSEMSWSRNVGEPSELVKPEDEVEVEILRVDPEKKRISVGMKQTQENPWQDIEQKCPVNEKVKGKVSKIADFGAFVEVLPGVEGLIHISELSDKRVRAVGDVVSEGQEVEARVIKVDPESKRISLSMKSPAAATTIGGEAGGRAGSKSKKKRKRPLRGGLSSHFDW